MNRDHAIVIGGSLGGLLAARVLTDHFKRVTLIERDVFPQVGENRRGVPQGRHTHGLLASGRNVMEKLFPGLSDKLIAAGALEGDIAGTSRWFTEGGCLARQASELLGLLVTRPLLEGTIRNFARSLSNLDVIEDATVDGILADPDHKRITGLHYTRGGASLELSANLVIDATGRGSKGSEWLGGLRYEAPITEKVEVALGYTTRFFRRNTRQLNGDVVAIIPPTPAGKRGGVMLAQEGDRWTVTLISHFGPTAPGDVDGFREFARTLPAPYIHEVVSESEPLGEPMTSRFPASVRRHYERLNRFPEGYLPFGDAICSFNPIYGQGMSVAALESEVLNECLAAGDSQLAARFFRRASKVIDIPWSIAVGNDLRMPETSGKRGAGLKFINWYISKLHKAAHHDPVLALAFLRVANLVAPPPSLMRPAMAWRVFRGNRRTRQSEPAEAGQHTKAKAAATGSSR